MRSSFKRFVLAVGLAATALLSACSGNDDGDSDVMTRARSNPDLTILVEAVDAAGLSSALSGSGPITLFAPTNAAFASLLTELGVSKADLLANKPLLTAVLKYHVLGSKVAKADVALGRQITPLAGGYFKIESAGGMLTLQDGRNRSSGIVTTDIGAKNGVIHTVNKVLLPANKTVVETAIALAAGDPAEFTILVEAVVAAGLADTLSGPGPFTVFAPTDAAFANLLAELSITKEALLADTELLTKVLTYHVVPTTVLKAEVPIGTAIATVQGESFTVGADLAITDLNARTANIIATDVFASNGVVHVIDKVILPTL